MASAKKATVVTKSVQSPVVTKAAPVAQATKALPTVAKPIAPTTKPTNARETGRALYTIANEAAKKLLGRKIKMKDFVDMYPKAQEGSGTWELRAKVCGYASIQEAGDKFAEDLASIPEGERGKGLGCARYKAHQAKVKAVVVPEKKPVQASTPEQIANVGAAK